MNTTATVRRLLTPAFVLAATLFAGTASAEDPVNVAQIGMTGYATLGAAFDALRDGDTVTLLQDYVPTIDENLMITNQDITFDLDGHYLNLSNACFLTEREARFFGVDAGANAVFTNGQIVMGYELAHDEPKAAAYGIGVYGTLDICCNLVRNGREAACLMVFDGGVVNVRPSAYISACDDVFRGEGFDSVSTINVYGGHLVSLSEKTTNFGYTLFYSGWTRELANQMKLPETTVIHRMVVNIENGVISCPNGFFRPDITYDQTLTDACKARFSTNWNTDPAIDSDYELALCMDLWWRVREWQWPSTFTVTFSTNGVDNVVTNLEQIGEFVQLTAGDVPKGKPFIRGVWDVDPVGAYILCETNFNYTILTQAYTVTFSTNTLDVAEAKLEEVEEGTALTAVQVPEFQGGTWDVDPVGAVITCDTNFNYTIVLYPTWLEGKGKEYEENYDQWKTDHEVKDPESTSAQEAFLLDCDDDPTAIAEAKANFKITAFSVSAGEVTVEVENADDYYGKVIVRGASDLDGDYLLQKDDPSARFFKAFLELIPANE